MWFKRRRKRVWERKGQAFGDFLMTLIFAIFWHIARIIFYLIKSIVQVISIGISVVFKMFKREKAIEASCLTATGCASTDNENRIIGDCPTYQPLTTKPGVKFEDIAGLERAKEEIMLRAVWPIRYPEKAKMYGIKLGGGILLFGPPGTGKTMLAKAVATMIKAAFFSVRPADVMSKWVGEAEKNFSRLLSQARSFEIAVIFLDEVEAFVPSRRSNGSTIMQRVIPQILSEIDGVNGKNNNVLLLIGASNEPGMIDPAMLRPGRFDAKIFVGLPDRDARIHILNKNIKERAVLPNLDLKDIAMKLDGYSGADIVRIVQCAADRAFIRAISNQQDNSLIYEEDFKSAIQEVNPSVSLKEINRHKQYAGFAQKP